MKYLPFAALENTQRITNISQLVFKWQIQGVIIQMKSSNIKAVTTGRSNQSQNLRCGLSHRRMHAGMTWFFSLSFTAILSLWGRFRIRILYLVRFIFLIKTFVQNTCLSRKIQITKYLEKLCCIINVHVLQIKTWFSPACICYQMSVELFFLIGRDPRSVSMRWSACKYVLVLLFIYNLFILHGEKKS